MGVLNEIFGPNKEVVWRQFAKEIGAPYIDGHYGNADRVEADLEKWQIIFDTYTSYSTAGTKSYSQEYTRIRAPFIPKDDLTFSIVPKGLINSIGKIFGAQDIVVGDSEFDKAFVIKGNDEFKIQTLFSNSKVRELILAQPKIHLEIVSIEGFWGEKLPEGVSELYFNIEDAITDLEQLKSLYKMFSELMDQLSNIGSAAPTGKISYEPK